MPHNRMHAKILVSVFTCLLLCMSPSCGRKDDLVVPGITQESIYNADGGFVITESMLDQPYNRITFPGTHNSYAGPDWHDACGNQHLHITDQLLYGIRFIELDVDAEGCASHNGFCTRPLAPIFNEIKEYARAHPRQIITISISDLACDRRYDDCGYYTRPYDGIPNNLDPKCIHAAPGVEWAYTMVNIYLEDTGLAAYIYNWDNSIQDNSNPAKCYIPEPWPTLREMFNSHKNIMFFHNRQTHDIIDSGYFRGLDYCEYISPLFFHIYGSYQLADLSKIQPVWEPGLCARQKEGYNRLFLLECNSQIYEGCEVSLMNLKYDCPGHHRAANDGRRLYQLAKQHEEDFMLLPDDRVANFISLDYFMRIQDFSGDFRLPVNIVDACNRLNYERFGLNWSDSYYAWEIEPYEIDRSKTEHIGKIPRLREEVESAIHDFQYKDEGLHGHETRGAIMSTPVYEQCAWSEKGPPTDWLWLPEWAIDDDYYTAWRGENWGGSLWIDLGAAKPIDEIAIAWKYTHLAPGYKIYVSNDEELDGVLLNAMQGAIDWVEVVQVPARVQDPPQPWDRVTFDLNSWRYIKIELTEAGHFWGSAIFELRVYGPAN